MTRDPMRSGHMPVVAVLLLLSALYVLAVGIRRQVYEAQVPAPGVVVPFTLESALQFRLVRLAFTGEGIPRHDTEIQYPEGVRTFALDTTWVEIPVAWAARLFPDRVPLAERVRWIHVLWFCLGIPLLALWIREETGSWPAGFAAGLLYATAVSAVVRSTGQEISHENYALPLLIAHLLVDARHAGRDRDPQRRFSFARAVASGLLLALALSAWDMIQVYTIFWSFWQLVAWIRRPRVGSDPALRYPATIWLMLGIAGIVSPYLRSHGFLLSPTMLCGYGVLLGAAWLGRRARRGTAPSRAARWLAGLPWLVAAPLSWRYAASYNHFAELLWAKVRYMNVKPEDPSLLTFAQRMLWTPALHSATVRLAALLFPAFLLLTAAAIVVVFFSRAHIGSDQRVRQSRAVFLFLASVLAFVFFVRFHVFVALLGSAVAGMALARLFASEKRRWAAVLAVASVLAAAAVEAGSVVRGAERWSRRVYYDQLDELTTWLRQHADRQPVLAGFGLSGPILAYGYCPILLHPKFESPDIRTRVEAYGRLLFGTEGEEPLRAWAEERGARYLVYGVGEFDDQMPGHQMRYMVNALDPPADAPARRFEFEPDAVEPFRLLWGNAKYRVFRVRRADDEEEWLFRQGAARDALIEGRLDEAERHANQALQIRPDDAESWRVIARVLRLRRAGFVGEVDP